MDIQTQLQDIGLTKSEGRVYLFLLENGISTPPQIAKATSIARTNCYHILQSLKIKSLIEEQTRGTRKVYLASDPESLIRALEKKKEATTRLLPDLRAMYTTQKHKPKITFYEGFEQVKQIYHMTYGAKEVYALGSIKYLASLHPTFFQSYMQGLKERDIVLHDILSYPSKEHIAQQGAEILKGLYNTRFASEKDGDFPTDILIWDDTIALITLENPIFGTVIMNPLLAQTFKMIHKMVWQSLPT